MGKLEWIKAVLLYGEEFRVPGIITLNKYKINCRALTSSGEKKKKPGRDSHWNLLYRIGWSHPTWTRTTKRGTYMNRAQKIWGFTASLCSTLSLNVPWFPQIPLELKKSQICWPAVRNVLWGHCIFTLNKIKLAYKNRRSPYLGFWVMGALGVKDVRLTV